MGIKGNTTQNLEFNIAYLNYGNTLHLILNLLIDSNVLYSLLFSLEKGNLFLSNRWYLILGMLTAAVLPLFFLY
jgi:hypothetical protein